MRKIGAGGRRSGFTLAELLVAALVGLLVLAGVHRIFVAGLGTETTTSLQTEVNRKAQVAIDSVVSRTRGGSKVEDAQGDRIWFVDQDGTGVRYWVSGGTLYRAEDADSYSGGVRVVTDVEQFALSYLDANGQPTASAAETVIVLVRLRVGRNHYSCQLESAVKLRNK